MRNAINILNSVTSHVAKSVMPSIVTMSRFSAVAFQNPVHDAGYEADPPLVKYIVCGHSACGSEDSPTGEVCRKY